MGKGTEDRVGGVAHGRKLVKGIIEVKHKSVIIPVETPDVAMIVVILSADNSSEFSSSMCYTKAPVHVVFPKGNPNLASESRIREGTKLKGETK